MSKIAAFFAAVALTIAIPYFVMFAAFIVSGLTYDFAENIQSDIFYEVLMWYGILGSWWITILFYYLIIEEMNKPFVPYENTNSL